MAKAVPPSRLALREEQRRREAATGGAIAASLGQQFTSVHLGNNDEVDCTINAGRARIAAVEITVDVDQDLQRDFTFHMTAPTRSQGIFHVVMANGLSSSVRNHTMRWGARSFWI